MEMNANQQEHFLSQICTEIFNTLFPVSNISHLQRTFFDFQADTINY